jgi:hypothetical protein
MKRIRTSVTAYDLAHLIFRGPCIVIHSLSTTNKRHLLSQIIYFCKTLYMLQTVFPSIIRSSKLRIQQRYISNSCCYPLMFPYSYVSFACLALINLIFMCPCIVIQSHSTTNKMLLLSQIIYSCKTLYMFRTVFPSIIRIPLLYTQFLYPDDGRKDRPKHVNRFTRINNFR